MESELFTIMLSHKFDQVDGGEVCGKPPGM